MQDDGSLEEVSETDLGLAGEAWQTIHAQHQSLPQDLRILAEAAGVYKVGVFLIRQGEASEYCTVLSHVVKFLDAMNGLGWRDRVRRHYRQHGSGCLLYTSPSPRDRG